MFIVVDSSYASTHGYSWESCLGDYGNNIEKSSYFDILLLHQESKCPTGSQPQARKPEDIGNI